MSVNLAGQRVLLAYGLMGDLRASLRLDYMRGVEAWLREQGADPMVVRLPTAAAVATNAARLATALLADPRPALIIAHSKGGLETLAALDRAETRARCAGFVALQVPFRGSQMADALLGAKPLAVASMALARMLRIGSGAGLRDLATTTRIAWMTAHAAAVAETLRRVPVVCLATTLHPDTARRGERLYLAAARWMEKCGAGPNDGMVAVDSALLPGAKHLVVPGSHLSSVSASRGNDPVALVARVVGMV